jgi:acetylornithine deacetylase/succinyl-diaminopimelate desuccinylase-like protein
LVPGQDPDQIYNSFVSFVTRHLPKRVTSRIIRSDVALPYKAPTSHPAFKLAKTILSETFGHPAVFVGQGGSIGAVPTLTSVLSIPALMIGFGLPDDNVHAPNEHLSLTNFHLGIQAMTSFYSRFSGGH